MVITELIKQNWKKSIRSQTFYKSLAVKILLSFMVLYFVVAFFMLGLFLGNIFDEMSDVLTPLEMMNSFSLYLVLFGILIRFMLQTLKTLDVQIYQLMPIKRKTIVNFLLIRPLFGLMNYFVLVVLIPFAFKSVVGYYSVATALNFLAVWVLIVWFDLWFSSYLKRKFGSSFVSFVVGLLMMAGIILLEYYHIFSLSVISKNIFNFLTIGNPFGLLIVLAFVVFAYFLNYSFFTKHYYLEEVVGKSEQKIDRISSELTFLEKYGTVGEVIRNLMRLIFRHKRTRSLFYVSIIFLFYGFLFYTNDAYQNRPAMIFFCAIVLTGIAMMMFGQWVYSWESNYFDALMTKNISIKDYVKANYLFLLVLTVASFVLTSPYFYLGIKIVYMHIVALLYNIGFNIPILLYFGTFNPKRIDLSNGSAFNYQGTTYKSFLIVLPVMGLPMLLLGLLGLFMTTETALMILAGLGSVSVIFTKQILNLCAEQLRNRKYAMAEGFREKE